MDVRASRTLRMRGAPVMTVTLHAWVIVAFVVAVPVAVEILYLLFLWRVSRGFDR